MKQPDAIFVKKRGNKQTKQLHNSKKMKVK